MSILKLKILLLAIAVTLLTIPSIAQPTSAQAVDAPWPMFGQNPAHTGEGQGPAPSYMVPNWKFKTDAGVHSSPAIVGGKVYFGSNDMHWYCVDAETGTLDWKFKTDWSVRTSPAVADGKVYTGADDGNIYCLDSSDGTQLWKTPTEGGLIHGIAMGGGFDDRGSPCVAGGRVYVGHLDMNIYCLDANTGNIIWSFNTGGTVISTPTVVGDKVYCGSGDTFLYCFNAADGNVIWKFRTVYPGESIPSGLGGDSYAWHAFTASYGDGNLYFLGGPGRRWWCVDAETGEPVWLLWPRRQRYNYQNPRPLDIKVGGAHPGDQPGHDPLMMRTAPLVMGCPAYHDGNLYLLEDYFMQRLNAATGERYWEPYPGMLNPEYTDYIANYTDLGYDFNTRHFNYELSIGFCCISSAMYADGKMYVGGNEASIYCNDAITGDRLSWYQTDSFIASSPALGYGNVYIGSYDHHLYCLKEGGMSAYREPGAYRTQTSITASLSSTSVVEGTPLTITGSTTPSGISDPYKGAPSVIAYFTRPDGTIWEETWHLKSNSYGWYAGDPTYELSYVPDMVGTWKVKVRLHSMQFDPYLPSETTEMTFTVTAASSSPTALQTSSALTMLGILAAPALVAVPIAAVLYKRKKK
jgi:outer membrane protein assembly factor BamB